MMKIIIKLKLVKIIEYFYCFFSIFKDGILTFKENAQM